MAISCVIITLNEAHHIKACIESVRTIVDEVIVVDAQSTDDTAAIAASAGAIVKIKRWEGYGAARNHGASIATLDWILSIDADERLSDKMIDSINTLHLDDTKVYTFNRKTQYCDQWIKYGTWNPDWKERLYHRHTAQWSDAPVHETLMLNAGISVERLRGRLHHYAYVTHQELVDRLDRYARLHQEKYPSGDMFKRVVNPIFHFTKSYVWKLGFLDGVAGYRVACAVATYHRKKYQKFNS